MTALRPKSWPPGGASRMPPGCAQRALDACCTLPWKEGESGLRWKRRFFVLYTSSPPRPRLYYFTSDRGARRMASLGEDTAQGYIELDRVVAVIFNQRTLDAIGRRDAHVLSTIVRAAASSGHDQL